MCSNKKKMKFKHHKLNRMTLRVRKQSKGLFPWHQESKGVAFEMQIHKNLHSNTYNK